MKLAVAIWNLPLWALLPLTICTLGITYYGIRWGREVLNRARNLLFTPESFLLALVYVATALGIQYGVTILQVSYFDRDVVIGPEKVK